MSMLHRCVSEQPTKNPSASCQTLTPPAGTCHAEHPLRPNTLTSERTESEFRTFWSPRQAARARARAAFRAASFASFGPIVEIKAPELSADACENKIVALRLKV